MVIILIKKTRQKLREKEMGGLTLFTVLISAFMNTTFCYFLRMSRKMAAAAATIADFHPHETYGPGAKPAG